MTLGFTEKENIICVWGEFLLGGGEDSDNSVQSLIPIFFCSQEYWEQGLQLVLQKKGKKKIRDKGPVLVG